MQIDLELCIFSDIIETTDNSEIADITVTTVLSKSIQYIWKY